MWYLRLVMPSTGKSSGNLTTDTQLKAKLKWTQYNEIPSNSLMLSPNLRV